MRQGTVKFFNDAKGFGFITEDDSKEDFFVHANDLIDQIKDGDAVEFEVKEGRKGPCAGDVKVVR